MNTIIYLWQDKKDSKIEDLLSLNNIASPAKIHAALKKLTKKNLFTFRQATNGRASYVELTALGLKRFNDLAKVISK